MEKQVILSCSDDRKSYARAFIKAGYEVTWFGNPADILHYLTQHEPEFLIMFEYWLNEIPHEDLIKKIQQQFPNRKTTIIYLYPGEPLLWDEIEAIVRLSRYNPPSIILEFMKRIRELKTN